MKDDWELRVVENAGEIPSDKVKDELVIPVKQLLTDIKAQLMLMPKHLNYTIGWRAIVWQKKETGRFQDLTDEEYKKFLETGTTNYTRGNTTDGGKGSNTRGDEGDIAT